VILQYFRQLALANGRIRLSGFRLPLLANGRIRVLGFYSKTVWGIGIINYVAKLLAILVTLPKY
jgi:hypothetical protein